MAYMALPKTNARAVHGANSAPRATVYRLLRAPLPAASREAPRLRLVGHAQRVELPCLLGLDSSVEDKCQSKSP